MKFPFKSGGSLTVEKKKSDPLWFPRIMWGVALLMVVFMFFIIWRKASGNLTVSPPDPATETVVQPTTPAPSSVMMPHLAIDSSIDAIIRDVNTHTVIPTGVRMEVEQYTVKKGDSIFALANQYQLKPDTILWSNYETLNDNPDTISVGVDLHIPPTDGILYKWKAGDTIEGIANKYHVEPDKILNWPGNDLDLTNPVIEPDTYVMVPGGWREYVQWLIPTVWKANAGASRNIAGGCDTGEGGAFGSGSFIWPAANQYLSGNDYFDGHLGIDIAAGTGAPVFAADSGVVVYAAPIGGGYGNMVMIDHGNGYHTVYAHLSQISISCGASVAQGTTVGYAGSTGNSTGPHLHFEVRYLGGFINPYFVLP